MSRLNQIDEFRSHFDKMFMGDCGLLVQTVREDRFFFVYPCDSLCIYVSMYELTLSHTNVI